MPLNPDAPAIVLIENDEVTLDLYRRELSKSFTVFGFTEVTGVVERMAAGDIRAVVIEPEIHSGDGWDLIRAIQTVLPKRSIPVIVCSTRDSNRAGPAGEVSRYLTKPVPPKTLREETLKAIQRMEKRHDPHG
jgi:DNA-binding response OmpR family regulator